MPIVSITSDVSSLTLTAVGEYPVPLDRLWRAWTDPRQMEQFWGPPSWPATFTRHDVRDGGRSDYFMTGPNGEMSYGYWEYVRVVPLELIDVRDGFSHPDGTPNDELPVSQMRMTFETTSSGSRFAMVSTFDNVEAMQTLLDMGMIEGLESAVGQLDDVLADLRESTRKTEVELVGSDQARITRLVRGTLPQVWRAHHEPDLVRQWMRGPEGWTMPVCEVATEVGQTYRYEWEQVGGDARFAFTGELLEVEPPRRSVTTEMMVGMEGPPTTNELILVPKPGGHTLVTLTITYPSTELRETILATGMDEGMEASYARLDELEIR